MASLNSLFESVVECLFRPVKEQVDRRQDDLEERLARMELITKRFHLQPGGLPGQQFFACCPALPIPNHARVSKLQAIVILLPVLPEALAQFKARSAEAHGACLPRYTRENH